MFDSVIQAIIAHFLLCGFREVSIGGNTSYQYHDEYYRLSRGDGFGYYLEHAATFNEAENNLFEDIEPYGVSFEDASVIPTIKSDIARIIAEKIEVA